MNLVSFQVGIDTDQAIGYRQSYLAMESKAMYWISLQLSYHIHTILHKIRNLPWLAKVKMIRKKHYHCTFYIDNILPMHCLLWALRWDLILPAFMKVCETLSATSWWPSDTIMCLTADPADIRLLHSPNMEAIGLSAGYETWPPICWHQAFVIGWSKYRLGLPVAPLHYGLTWTVGIPTVFHTPVTVPLHCPNGRQLPAVRAVQWDCERV